MLKCFRKSRKIKIKPSIDGTCEVLTFQYYPLELVESQKAEWAKCVISIDEFNWRLKQAKEINAL